jgi:hypothetical protein
MFEEKDRRRLHYFCNLVAILVPYGIVILVGTIIWFLYTCYYKIYLPWRVEALIVLLTAGILFVLMGLLMYGYIRIIRKYLGKIKK